MGATLYLFADSMEQETKALARGLRSRDPDLLDRLIEQYQYRLFRYLLSLTGSRETAEDLFQETWVHVLERGHQYDGKSRFEAWLFAIARHLAIDLLRKKAPQSLDDLADSGEAEIAARPTASAIDLLSRREAGERVEAALGHLPAVYREVLVLRFQEELALEEISAVVAVPLSTVKSRLYRGLDELRGLLGGAER
jgi:RNA polymerase sigma-70 factor, ECF subfamily